MGSMGVQDNGTAQLWLRLYEHGTADQKAEAAVQLGLLLEQRGLLAEAVEWYEQNIRAGDARPILYERLAGLYRRQGRTRLARNVLEEAGKRALQPPAAQRRAVGREQTNRVALVALVIALAALALAAYGALRPDPAQSPAPASTAPLTATSEPAPVSTPVYTQSGAERARREMEKVQQYEQGLRQDDEP